LLSQASYIENKIIHQVRVQNFPKVHHSMTPVSRQVTRDAPTIIKSNLLYNLKLKTLFGANTALWYPCHNEYINQLRKHSITKHFQHDLAI